MGFSISPGGLSVPSHLDSHEEEYWHRMMSVASANLIGFWPLWEPAGATAIKDYSRQGNDGTPSDVTFGGDAWLSLL